MLELTATVNTEIECTLLPFRSDGARGEGLDSRLGGELLVGTFLAELCSDLEVFEVRHSLGIANLTIT